MFLKKNEIILIIKIASIQYNVNRVETMTIKAAFLIGLLWISIVFFSGCTQQSPSHSINQGLGAEIMNIGQAIPQGWNYTIITQNLEEIPRPHGLWKPTAIVNFSNPSLTFEVAGGTYQHPSIWLFFYNISEKQEIIGVIINESVYSWCIPIYFNETQKYIIVTSPCYINSGVFTEEAQRYYTVLEKSLDDYFQGFSTSE
jgi:hypothetical protein